MAAVTLWIASMCRPDPGYGGWSFVRRADGEALKGAAGGERRTSAAKMSLSALTEALDSLSDLPRTMSVVVHVADPGLAGELAASDGAYATAEPQAWAVVRAVLDARPTLELLPAAPTDGASGFLRAWAEFGLDTAKTRGGFKAAIPKPNLLKFPG